MIADYLEREVPKNWDSFSLGDRRRYWNGNLVLPKDVPLIPREKVCAVEIWTECFNGDAKYLKRQDSTEINNILLGMRGWKRNKSLRRYGPHGAQKGIERA